MDEARLQSLLARLQGIRHSCDLDLALFFKRHPLALLTSEQLVSYLGYDRDRIATSLDALIDSGLLTRSQTPAHAARLYSLETGGSIGGSLVALLGFASTRQGRRAVIGLLEPVAPIDPKATGRAQHSASVTPIVMAA